MNTLIQLLSNSVYAYEPVGVIALPTGVPSEISSTTTVISGLIRFIIVIAGIFSLWQFLTGGLAFISSGGDKGKITEAQNKIQMSIVGLVIIAASFIIIAIISQLLFGSFTYILAPNIESISAPAAPVTRPR